MRRYLHITGAIFGIVAIVHILRLAFGWPAQIAGWSVPMWVSWVAIVLAGGLCLWAFRLAARA